MSGVIDSIVYDDAALTSRGVASLAILSTMTVGVSTTSDASGTERGSKSLLKSTYLSPLDGMSLLLVYNTLVCAAPPASTPCSVGHGMPLHADGVPPAERLCDF